MKKRINILCILFFVVILVQFGLRTLSPCSATGVDSDYTEKKGELAGTEITFSAGNTTGVVLTPKTGKNATSFTLKGGDGKEDVRIWPVEVRAEIKQDATTGKLAGGMAIGLLSMALELAIIVTFVRLIVRINRQEVFSWRNVRRLRVIGGCLIILGVVGVASSLVSIHDLRQVLTFRDYDIDHYGEFALMMQEFFLGIIALIAAEAWAYGLKLQEEQALTI